MRHLRSLIAALAVLALGAGIAAAHPMPAASDFGLSTASSASGMTLPMDDPATLRDAQQQADVNVNAVPDATPSSDTHGAAVSSAAQSPTPDGYANHGQYVRSVATGWGQQTASQHRANPSAAPSDEPVDPVDTSHPKGPLQH